MPDWASLSRFEIRHVTLPLQRYRALDVPSQVLGHSVSGEAMLPLFASLYWCLDQHKCFCGIWLVPLSEMANGVVKWLTRRGRPAWVDERVMMHQWSSEFSFPSSHSQLAAAVMTWLVLSSAHAEAATSTPALPSAAYALLVAASRVHVGLHFPSDVAVGLLWGALSAAAYAHIVLPSLPSFVHWSATSRLCALLLPAAAAGLAVHAAYCVAERSRGSDPPEWSRNACRGRYKGRELDPRGVPHGNYMGMLGVLAGLAVGGAFKHLFPLHYPGSGASAFVRAVVGNGGLLALFEGIGAATPRQPLRLYAALRFLKYWLVPVYILLLAPYAFVRLGL
mmetsp:Transcript_29743/g.95641  ORF Transcript_29743/g.95641 Transcript_29743/m.95641 type:complete len:336 (+) Transcript_29743:49-1056(+)